MSTILVHPAVAAGDTVARDTDLRRDLAQAMADRDWFRYDRDQWREMALRWSPTLQPIPSMARSDASLIADPAHESPALGHAPAPGAVAPRGERFRRGRRATAAIVSRIQEIDDAVLGRPHHSPEWLGSMRARRSKLTSQLIRVISRACARSPARAVAVEG